MRWSWIPLILVVMGSASVLGGEHFRIKAKLLPGAPRGVNYRHSDVVSRGTYTAMLEKEEIVADLNFIRQIQNPPVSASTTETTSAPDREEPRAIPGILPPNTNPSLYRPVADARTVGPTPVTPSAKRQTFRKVFRSSPHDVAATADRRSVDATPVRLDDIRLAAYSDGSDGYVLFTGRIQDLPKTGSADTTVKERTDGCRVTIRVRGFSSTEVASTAVSPNGPLLFECVQSFWMSKQDNYAISLVCPEEVRLCGSHYQELTHIQVEVETRRNR